MGDELLSWLTGEFPSGLGCARRASAPGPRDGAGDEAATIVASALKE
eukprot:gene40412-44363_t